MQFGGKLYELDGRNFSRSAEDAEAWPVFHGPTSPESFLLDAAKVVQEDFMARDPQSVNFNLGALSKCED